MAKEQVKNKVQTNKETINKNFLSIILDNKAVVEEDLAPHVKDKIDLFEKGLSNAIFKTDTIDKAIEKVVKTALACEFGPGFVVQKGADKMIKTISAGIISSSELRKQALVIIDKFAETKKSKLMKRIQLM